MMVVVVVVVMNIIVRALIVILLELPICAIAVATCHIVSDAGGTYHSIVSVVDSIFVRYFVKLSMSHLFSITFFSMLVNYIRRTNQYTDARY